MSKKWSSRPPMSIDRKKTCTAPFETSRGTVVCDLFAADARKTVKNSVFPDREWFYDGTTFRRVIKDFIVQGGDPTATGTSGPGYECDDEFTSTWRKHQRGSLSMANVGPNTSGSQFCITHVVTHWLDKKHVVFGQVRSGHEVVDSIAQGDKLVRVTISIGES